MGARVRQPALEIVSGSPGLRSHFDGTTETDGELSSENTPPAHGRLHFEPDLDTAPWTQIYRECVGSSSALKSDPELRSLSADEGHGHARIQNLTLGGMSSAELRGSTVDFQSRLGNETEAAKEGLLRKADSMQDVHV